MAGTSPRPAARIVISLIAPKDSRPKTKRPGISPGAPAIWMMFRSAAVAEQPQQHEEQVDEVEIERQRTHHRLAAGDGAIVHHAVHFLDLLRVVGGQTD